MKFTQEEFQFGRADWSISSMTVLGETSWMMEVERERRRWRVSFMPMLPLADCVRMSVAGTDIGWEERLGRGGGKKGVRSVWTRDRSRSTRIGPDAWSRGGRERKGEGEGEGEEAEQRGGRSVGERVVEGVVVKLSWRWCAGSICRLVICCPGSGHSTFRAPISIPTVL